MEDERAWTLIDVDLSSAERLLETAFGLDATNPRVKSMRVLVSDRKRTAAVDQYLSRARKLQATNELEKALGEVEKGLSAHPGDPRLIQLQTVLATNLKGSQKQSELRQDRGKILELQRRSLELSHEKSQIKSLFEESQLLAKKHPGDKQIQILVDEIGKAMERRYTVAAPVAAENDANVSRVRKHIPDAYRVAMIVVIVGAIVGTAFIIAKSFLNRPKESEEFKRVGTAVVAFPLSLHREPSGSSEVVGSLDAGEPVELLNELPPFGVDNSTLIRSLNQPSLQGYASIGDLDNLETGNRQFDIEHGLAMMRRSTDVSERKKRLESIDLAIRTNPLVTSEESDNIYLEISENYLQLLPADPAKAEEYLQRVEGRLLSSERAQRQKEMIQSIRDKLTSTVRGAPVTPSPTTAPRPTQPDVPISYLVNAAKIKLNNGRSLEQTGDAAGAKDQYAAAISFCERIFKIDPKNAQARTICQDAKDADGAINRGETPR